MKLTFLGTAAANAFPEAFCRCDNCETARERGGRSLRKRSAALIDDELLIDLGPDVMSAAQQHGVRLTGVRYCLVTHPHADHFDASHLLSRSPGFGVVGAPLLHLYATAATLAKAAEHFERDLAAASFMDPNYAAILNLRVHELEHFVPSDIAPYRVTPLPANHDRRRGSSLYAVQTPDRSLFYGTDTAALDEDVWTALRENEMCFDIVVLDHTYGPHEEAQADHMGAADVASHVARMRDEGILATDGRAFATHIAHEGNPAHPELVEHAARHGYEVAYDGLTV